MPASSPISVGPFLGVSGDDAPRRVEAMGIPALTRTRDLAGDTDQLPLQVGMVAR